MPPLEFPTNPGDNMLHVMARGAALRREVTALLLVNNIWYVSSRTAQKLTKRRAVDFCRVAGAMCMRPLPVSRAHSAA
jgi:hypothetical protein